jgi:ATP-dependent DNA helicase RecQ
VADILVKPGPLSTEEERVLSEALDFRGRAARAHLDAIGRYANLATCRREHLLSHFGDSAALGAAPCGGCDVCNPRPGLDAPPSPGRRALAALAAFFGATRS